MVVNRQSFQAIEVYCQGDLWVHWGDGQVSLFPCIFLRRNCMCAQCVDEISGKRRTWQGDMASLAIGDCEYVGNYGLRLRFNDGHGVGIYHFKRLRDWFNQARQTEFPAGGPQLAVAGGVTEA